MGSKRGKRKRSTEAQSTPRGQKRKCKSTQSEQSVGKPLSSLTKDDIRQDTVAISEDVSHCESQDTSCSDETSGVGDTQESGHQGVHDSAGNDVQSTEPPTNNSTGNDVQSAEPSTNNSAGNDVQPTELPTNSSAGNDVQSAEPSTNKSAGNDVQSTEPSINNSAGNELQSAELPTNKNDNRDGEEEKERETTGDNQPSCSLNKATDEPLGPGVIQHLQGFQFSKTEDQILGDMKMNEPEENPVLRIVFDQQDNDALKDESCSANKILMKEPNFQNSEKNEEEIGEDKEGEKESNDNKEHKGHFRPSVVLTDKGDGQTDIIAANDAATGAVLTTNGQNETTADVIMTANDQNCVLADVTMATTGHNDTAAEVTVLANKQSDTTADVTLTGYDQNDTMADVTLTAYDQSDATADVTLTANDQNDATADVLMKNSCEKPFSNTEETACTEHNGTGNNPDCAPETETVTNSLEDKDTKTPNKEQAEHRTMNGTTDVSTDKHYEPKTAATDIEREKGASDMNYPRTQTGKKLTDTKVHNESKPGEMLVPVQDSSDRPCDQTATSGTRLEHEQGVGKGGELREGNAGITITPECTTDEEEEQLQQQQLEMLDSQILEADGSAFETDVTESQLCAVSDEIMDEVEQAREEEAISQQQQEGEKITQTILENLLSLNKQIIRTRRDIETERRKLQKMLVPGGPHPQRR